MALLQVKTCSDFMHIMYNFTSNKVLCLTDFVTTCLNSFDEYMQIIVHSHSQIVASLFQNFSDLHMCSCGVLKLWNTMVPKKEFMQPTLHDLSYVLHKIQQEVNIPLLL